MPRNSLLYADGLDSIQHIPHTSEEGTILTRFHLINLYTNTTNTLGLEAIKHKVEKHKGRINKCFKTDFFRRLIQEENDFKFGKNILTVKSMAMETQFAPSYANLIWESLKKKYGGVEKVFTQEYKKYIIKNGNTSLMIAASCETDKVKI